MGPLRRIKTKRRTRDIDQVHKDLRSKRHLEQFKETKAPEDLPGLGRYYCSSCARWFESEKNMTEHRRGKRHKRRVRMLKEEPHTQKEAEAAVGLRTDNGIVSKMDVESEARMDDKELTAEMEVDKNR